MVKQHNPPVNVVIYLGSGERGQKLRERLEKKAAGESLSSYIVGQLEKADPSLKAEKGGRNGK